MGTLKATERMGSEALESPEGSWWAVYTRHQHEKTVASMLTTKGFEVFLPVYETVRRWKDRNKLLTLPLFPCYVFLRGGWDRKLQVVTTPGIHSVLCRGENVAMIPEPEMEAIRVAVDGRMRMEPHPYLKSGDRVRVVRGAMAGVEGILVRKKNLCRLVISVQMLAQSVAVEIDALDVEPARQEAAPGMNFGRGAVRESVLFGAGSKEAEGIANPSWA